VPTRSPQATPSLATFVVNQPRQVWPEFLPDVARTGARFAYTHWRSAESEERAKLTGLPWNHARSRRSCPLHRWLMDDAATAELPARPSFRPGAMHVGHQPCSTCRGGHTTWTCLDCGGVVYGPALTAGCRILVGAAAVR
jgi:hypothetical protein